MSTSESIYLDIETIPTQDSRIKASIVSRIQDELNAELSQVKAPGNIKDPEKIATAIDVKRAELQAKAVEDLEKAYRATALDGAYGQVAVCSIAVGNGEPVALYEEAWDKPGSEVALLNRINQHLAEICGHYRGQLLIGHNILGFDRKFLRQRGIIHGIRMHPLLTKEVKPWDSHPVFDTMIAWSGDVRDKVSMNRLCLAFNVPDKGDIDGSKVWDYVRDGRIAEVAAYCNGDVERTRTIYKRLMFLGEPIRQPDFDDVPA